MAPLRAYNGYHATTAITVITAPRTMPVGHDRRLHSPSLSPPWSLRRYPRSGPIFWQARRHLRPVRRLRGTSAYLDASVDATVSPRPSQPLLVPDQLAQERPGACFWYLFVEQPDTARGI